MLDLACSCAAGTPLNGDTILEKNSYIRLPYEIITKENIKEYVSP